MVKSVTKCILQYSLLNPLGLTVLALLLGACVRNPTPANSSTTQYWEKKKQSQEGNESPVLLTDLLSDLYFKDIEKRSEQSGLKLLRQEEVPAGDIEIRIWQFPSVGRIGGYRFQREKNIWRGWYIPQIVSSPFFKGYTLALKPPRSGWDTFWERITKHKIIGLSTCKYSTEYSDPSSLVVETYQNGAYRYFMFVDTVHNIDKCPDIKELIEIIKIINEEFEITIEN